MPSATSSARSQHYRDTDRCDKPSFGSVRQPERSSYDSVSILLRIPGATVPRSTDASELLLRRRSRLLEREIMTLFEVGAGTLGAKLLTEWPNSNRRSPENRCR